jgi:hypothetical protein
MRTIKLLSIPKVVKNEFENLLDEELLRELDEYTLEGARKFKIMRLLLEISARHRQLLYNLDNGWRHR